MTNGVLIIDKPAGLTSHDVVNRVRRILRQRSIGHLGTLDPLATGVLPLVVGSFTRLAQFYTSSAKAYEGVIRLGFATDTFDAEGEPTSPPRTVKVSLEGVREVARRFRGSIEQIPPPFSAKKVQGVPAYKLARAHKDVDLRPAVVEVKEFEIVAVEGERVYFSAMVAAGTYMRSVAHDIGQALGCGAHLESLRRTASAEFSAGEAHSLEQLQATPTEKIEEILVHPRKILPEFPSVAANDEMVGRIRNGRTVNLPEFSRAARVKVFVGQRELIAVAMRVAGTLFHPAVVLTVQAEAIAKQHQR